jgi:hypothetical protein
VQSCGFHRKPGHIYAPPHTSISINWNAALSCDFEPIVNSVLRTPFERLSVLSKLERYTVWRLSPAIEKLEHPLSH